MTVPLHWVERAGVQASTQVAAHTAGLTVSSQNSPVAEQSVPSTHSRQPPTSVQVWIT